MGGTERPLAGARIDVSVNGEHIVTFNDDDARGLETGAIGVRQFHRAARYRNLRYAADASETEIPFVEQSAAGRAVSRMWQPFSTGDPHAIYELTRKAPFVGAQSQEIEFAGGAGAVGIANRGLNGWGIVDFMNFCEAAGFEYVPTLCMGETPESLAAFVAYATAPVDSEWGAKRARDGHPQPYRLKYLQLGNKERVDVDFAERFRRAS